MAHEVFSDEESQVDLSAFRSASRVRSSDGRSVKRSWSELSVVSRAIAPWVVDPTSPLSVQ